MSFEIPKYERIYNAIDSETAEKIRSNMKAKIELLDEEKELLESMIVEIDEHFGIGNKRIRRRR